MSGYHQEAFFQALFEGRVVLRSLFDPATNRPNSRFVYLSSGDAMPFEAHFGDMQIVVLPEGPVTPGDLARADDSQFKRLPAIGKRPDCM